MRRLALLLPVLLLLRVPSADALVLLTEGRVGIFRNDPATGEATARIVVGRDRGLRELRDPTVCPASASLQIASYPSALNLVVAGPPVELPCERWARTPAGYEYRDPSGSAGGVRSVRYGRDGLSVYARTPGLEPVVGPVGYVQMWLTVGDARYLVRLHGFAENDERQVVTRRTTRAASAGEAAFWDTIWGDADRGDEALDLLRGAVARDRRDGRSHFLIAMMHLYRYGREVADPLAPSARGKLHAVAARRAFDRAVPLLWDGTSGVGDSRVPGFAAAATYAKGVGFGDPAETERGVAELEHAAEINTLFNSFDLFAVAPAVPWDDPLYDRVLELLDVTFPEVASQCSTQSEICFNDGMAPHNLEGTFVLFGDIYAKGGRIEDARDYYGSAASLGESGGWDPRFVATARERVATVEQRSALYRDGDPTNDPPFMGSGGASACAYCHLR